MERVQQRSEIAPNSIRGEMNSRLSLQLNQGAFYSRRKRENFSDRSPTTGESTEVEDDEPEDDEPEDDYTDEQLNNSKDPGPTQRPMICGLCHLAPGVAGVAGVSTNPGPMLTCTQGHLLCQQCLHRYTICSDIGCVVCGADLYASTASCYRITRQTNVQSSSGDPRGVQVIRKSTRSSAPGDEAEYQSKNRSRNFNEIGRTGPAILGSNSRCTTGYNSGWEGDSGDVGQPLANVGFSRLHPRQQRSCCSMARGGDADLEPEVRQRIGSFPGDTGNGNVALIHTECSRRPIRCPRLDCAVNVAFSALTHHFLFDHPEVPILSVEPEAKSTLIVSFASLSCDSSRCLALLLVSGKLTGAAARLFNGSQIQPRYRNRLPLPVLAARLHWSSQNPCEDDGNSHGEEQSQGDIVIAWVAGLDVGDATTGTLRCSIQVVDGNDDGGLRSLTYTGPVNSLRTAQRPREVFATGDCVILHQGFIDHITSGSTSLNVNVTVH